MQLHERTHIPHEFIQFKLQCILSTNCKTTIPIIQQITCIARLVIRGELLTVRSKSPQPSDIRTIESILNIKENRILLLCFLIT